MFNRLRLMLTIALLFAIVTTTVLAHMKASKFEPLPNSTVTASPERVQVWFTQAPDPKLSKLELTGPSGQVKLAAPKITSDKSIVSSIEGVLANGKYSVRWQAAGDDGHVQKGEFAFSVKSAPAN